jgi:hypothetical protein
MILAIVLYVPREVGVVEAKDVWIVGLHEVGQETVHKGGLVRVLRHWQPREPAQESKDSVRSVTRISRQCSGQGCGSGSGLDPDSIGSVDQDPDSESGSGSRRAKMTHKKIKEFHVLKCWMASFESCRLFSNLYVLYGGLGIGKLQFLI